VEQFEIFVDQISRGGILVYNEEDLEVKRVQKRQQNQP
jgi:UDP-N-acetylmuramate: L-alanyl-gamma-D-glutamyl-meso-diaminopimelate ligase